jgi:pectate lyase
MAMLLAAIVPLGVVPNRFASSVQAAGLNWKQYSKNDDAWFAGPQASQLAENILSHQSSHGSWPKNVDTSQSRYMGEPEKLRGTWDNGATRGEIRFLAHAYRAMGQKRYLSAVIHALDQILGAQYPNGGFPQYEPARGYSRHITFNDGTMVGLLELLRDVARDDAFDFIDADRRAKADKALHAGIDCILDCQIVRDDVPTAWCAQHDEVTLEPRGARSYEHPSFSGSESAGIVRFLMSLEDPSPRVIAAVEGACRWFQEAQVTGIRQVTRDGDKIIVADPAAGPLWARFYDLQTNRPIFSGRDGKIRDHLSEIEQERRTGYSWYGTAPQGVLDDLPAWQAKHGGSATSDANR